MSPAASSRVRPAVTVPSPDGVPLVDRDTLPALDVHQRPWPGREVTAGGVTLHVRETPGSGEAEAVYVHGLSGSALNWTDLAGLLRTRAAGTAVDLPGFGCSRPLPSRDYAPAAHADALLCFLAGRDGGRGRPVHLLGNSLGGAIAMTVAARRPELVATLTLISPAMPDRRPDPRRLSDRRLALALLPGRIGRDARAQIAAMDGRTRAEQMVRMCFGDPTLALPHRLDEAAVEHGRRAQLEWAEEALERTTKAMLASWWRGESLWSVAARVPAPTLVVWGGRDRIVSPRLAARTAAAFPNGRLVMLPGAGHVAQIEVPEQVARAVAGLWAHRDTW